MVYAGFLAFPILLGVALALAVHRAGGRAWQALAGLAAWMAVTGGMAAQGLVADFASVPPPLLRVVGLANLVALVFALTTRYRWSLAGLIAFQGFRLPLELLMHRAYADGIMPGQMTYTGRNFDILTGASALVVAWLLGRGLVGWRTALLWNLGGLALLINVVSVAIMSFPGPWQSMWPSNLWVTQAPYVWLPTVMVPFALAGHVLVFREVRRSRHSCG